MLKSKPWYKKWWGVILAILIWPFFLIWYLWSKSRSGTAVKVSGTVGILILAILSLVVLGTVLPTPPPTTHTSSTPAKVKTTAAVKTKPKTASKPKPPTTNDKLTAVLKSLKQKYPTVNESYLYTKNRDPDQGLGVSGWYHAGAAFCDTATQVQPSSSVTAGSAGNAYGYSCGGVIEVYSNTKDVATRVAYYDNFKGNPQLTQCQTVSGQQVCDYEAVGDVFLHISDQYPPSEWTAMLDYLSQQVQEQQL